MTDPQHTFIVKLATDKEIKEMELLTREHLSRFNMEPSDIKTVSANFAVPGYLYEEIGEASSIHPCAGSACAVFIDPDGHQCSIDDIIYYDRNPHRSHTGGQPHWNNEIRYMRDGKEIDRTKRIVSHIIQDAAQIEVETNFDGNVNRQEILRDQPVKKTHSC